MKNPILIILTLLFSLGFTAVREPYLEIPTHHSVWINWKSDAEKDFTIEYGTSSSNLNLSKSVNTETWSDNGYNNNYLYSSVQLTGLNPKTKYYYRIKNSTYTSPVYDFVTMPEPGKAANNGKTRLLIMGDNQLKGEPRFDSLVVKAKRFVETTYQAPVNEVISGILMVGDQVDVGTLDHYEFVHFDKVKYISPWLGTSTIIGNHETYGTLKLKAYYDHFHYENLQYSKVPSNTEEYYAYQAGGMLIVNLNTDASNQGYTNQANMG
ncbi:MAG: fibronectin type III domain-containing protein, partial [Cytophagales bacterium]